MPLHTFPAIVLQSYETGNTSEAVRTFSGRFGRLAVMARGVRNPKRPLAGVLQPLARVELTVSLREGAEMATLREATLLDDRTALQGDLERLALAFLLAEIAAESCDEAQPSEEMFDVLEAGLAALDPRAAQPAPTAALHHLLRILALAGYEPHIDPALLAPWPVDRPKPRVFWLDAAEGRLHAQLPQPDRAPEWPLAFHHEARQVPLPPQAVRALHENQHTPHEDLAVLPALDSAHANQLLAALVRLARWHLGHPVRSVRFWKDIVGLGE
ncbi:MAG: DNA repair protein RecO [Candidatus Sumerlaeia bacterium]|nr:DNA repair protein RecO [Candidatus Sumerlaeia bacterium]